MMGRCIVTRFFWITIIFNTVWAGPTLAHELVIFLDPRGSDTFDGLSEQTSVASLPEAIRIAELVSDKDVSHIRIAVAPGEYEGQTAKANGNIAGLAIEVAAADPNRPRPRFNGGRHGGTWLSIRSAKGKPTKYRISWLEITNYETAINFAGDRNHGDRSNGGNAILDNVFTDIGQIARAGALPSTAALRLVNSDDNVIADNRFIHIVNVERCAQLHSIYLAHGSTGNVIENNVFENSCGDAIRFRDRSDSNIVRNNTFIDSWAEAPISDWYCDRDRRSDCTKSTPECPSMNNVLDGNKVVARKLAPAPDFSRFGDDSHPNCSRYQNDKRFVIK